MAGSIPRSVEFAGGTDVGRVRSQNEDSFQIDSDLGLILVADGMGGHIGGDIASRTAIEAVNDYILEYEPPEDGRGSSELDPIDASVDIARTAVYRANQRIVGLNRERGLPEGRRHGNDDRRPVASRRLVARRSSSMSATAGSTGSATGGSIR